MTLFSTFDLGATLAASPLLQLPMAQVPAAEEFHPMAMVESLVWAVAAVVMLAVVFTVFVRVMPFSVKKEIVEDQNTSLGIIMAALILGLCYIMGRTFGG